MKEVVSIKKRKFYISPVITSVILVVLFLSLFIDLSIIWSHIGSLPIWLLKGSLVALMVITYRLGKRWSNDVDLVINLVPGQKITYSIGDEIQEVFIIQKVHRDYIVMKDQEGEVESLAAEDLMEYNLLE